MKEEEKEDLVKILDQFPCWKNSITYYFEGTFEWVPLNESGKYCEVRIFRWYFNSIILFSQNGTWVNEKLFLKVRSWSWKFERKWGLSHMGKKA